MFNFGSLILGPLIFPFISKFVFNFRVFISALIFPGFILLFILKSSLLDPFKSPSIGSIINLGLFIFLSGISIFILLPYNLLEPLILKPSKSAFPGIIPVKLNPDSGFGIFGTSPSTLIFGPFIFISFSSTFMPIFGLLKSTFKFSLISIPAFFDSTFGIFAFTSGRLLSICKLILGFFIFKSFSLISNSGDFKSWPLISTWLSKFGKPILFSIPLVSIFIFGVGKFKPGDFISIFGPLPEILGPFRPEFIFIPCFSSW